MVRDELIEPIAHMAASGVRIGALSAVASLFAAIEPADDCVDNRAYVYEISPFENDEVKTLRENDEKIAAWTGEDVLYLRPIDDRSEIESRFGADISQWTNPSLLVFEESPDRIEPGTKFVKFELGNFDDSAQLTRELQVILDTVADDDFMEELTWRRRKQKLKRRLSEVSDRGSDIVSIVTVGL